MLGTSAQTYLIRLSGQHGAREKGEEMGGSLF